MGRYRFATPLLVTKNLKRIFYHEYLTEDQLAFLFELLCYVGHETNIIYPDKLILKERFTPNELAGKLSELIKKGIVFVVVDNDQLNQPLFIDGQLNPSVTLYMNPELCFNGILNKIPLDLVDLIRHFNFIEDNKVELSFKAVYKKGGEYGYLVPRGTYLQHFKTLCR